MANLSLIDFKIGLYIKGNVTLTAGKNKFEVHTYQFAQYGHQLAQNRPEANFDGRFSQCLFFKEKSNGDNN